LKIDGQRETFTATVTFDTRGLYGTVTASCQFALSAD
jgi:hypothetical protein